MHFICIRWISNLEIIYSIWEDVCRLCSICRSQPSYRRCLSICGIWYPWGICSRTPWIPKDDYIEKPSEYCIQSPSWRWNFPLLKVIGEFWQAVLTEATEWVIFTLPLSQGRFKFCSASPPYQLDFQKRSPNGQNWDQPGRDTLYVNVTCVWVLSL